MQQAYHRAALETDHLRKALSDELEQLWNKFVDARTMLRDRMLTLEWEVDLGKRTASLEALRARASTQLEQEGTDLTDLLTQIDSQSHSLLSAHLPERLDAQKRELEAKLPNCKVTWEEEEE